MINPLQIVTAGMNNNSCGGENAGGKSIQKTFIFRRVVTHKKTRVS